MKRPLLLGLLLLTAASAEEVTLTRSAVLKADRSIVALKAGTVVELVDRDEKTLTVRYNKVTGTIPASSIAPAAADEKKKAEPAPPPPEGKAQSMYGKAVEKAKENAAKHDKNVAKPVDEVLSDK